MKTVWMLLLAVLPACSSLGKIDEPYKIAAADRDAWKTAEGAVAQIDATFVARKKPDGPAEAVIETEAVEDAMDRAAAAMARERLEIEEAEDLQRNLRAFRKAAGASLARRTADTTKYTLSQQDVADLGGHGKTIEDSTRRLEDRLREFLDKNEKQAARNVKVLVEGVVKGNKLLGGSDPRLDRAVVVWLELLEATLAKAIETRSISADTFDAGRLSKALETQLAGDWKPEYVFVVQGVLLALEREIPAEGRLEGKNLRVATYVNRGVTEVLAELRDPSTASARQP